MMLTLHEIIQVKYPSAKVGLGGDVHIADHGDGPVISMWEVPDVAQPTQAQLIAWKTDPLVRQAYILRQNILENSNIIGQLEAIDIKSIRALRTNDKNKLAELEREAVELRSKLLPTT